MISDNLRNHIVTAIKQQCKEKGIKISVLLREAESSQHLIDDWQNGKTEPSFPTLSRICKVLNIDVEELFKMSQKLTETQAKILDEWRSLSDMEKQSLLKYITAMKAYH